ncbi:hypothetical protein LCGC14_1900350 [marine sediment metagenome]|uniref:Uncharacterized protein n=1 Tax=marine sediment metagenome TaxID=412755 RepID=A0A0F9FWU2_9ZZZZ
MTTTEMVLPVTNVIEAIHPFQPDDSHKGTFLVLRMAGLEQSLALRLIKRKYRSLLNWRSTDEDFKRIDNAMPVLNQKFGGEARVLRTALLDISIVETGISIFRKILSKQPVSEGMWAYAVKMAGLRVPMMGAEKESSSPWERLANSIKQTMNQKELTIEQKPDGTQSIIATEITIEPSQEQRMIASNIVQEMLQRAGAS